MLVIYFQLFFLFVLRLHRGHLLLKIKDLGIHLFDLRVLFLNQATHIVLLALRKLCLETNNFAFHPLVFNHVLLCLVLHLVQCLYISV